MSFDEIIFGLFLMVGSSLLVIAINFIVAKFLQKENKDSHEIKTKGNTSKSLKNLIESLSEMPLNMRLFSLSMRSLYADKAVGGSSNVAVDLRKLRDSTRDDAMVYLKGVLPVAKEFVSNIIEFFANYSSLSFESWCSNLGNIHEDIKNYKKLAEVLIKLHEDIMVSLKKREDKAALIIKSMVNLQEEYEKKIQALERSADIKNQFALGLVFVPTIGKIAFPLLISSARWDIAESVAKAEEMRIQGSAVIAIEKCLIPAVSKFIAGLKAAAGFFSIMEQELSTFEKKSKTASNKRLELHYDLMMEGAEEMDEQCKKFYAVLPDVRSDFLAIPTTGTNKSYVDMWLAKQKEEIFRELHDRSPDFLKAITDAI